MKKTIILIFGAMLIGHLGFSQSPNPLSSWLAEERLQVATVPTLSLFQKDVRANKEQWGTYYSLTLDKAQIQKLYRSNTRYFLLKVPVNTTQTVTLELAEAELLTDDFVANAVADGRVSAVDFQRPRQFRGIVQGASTRSLASITIGEDGLRGLFSFENKDYNLGPRGNITGGDDYLLFSDREFQLPLGFQCGATAESETHKAKIDEGEKGASNLVHHCVRVRVEVNNGLYNQLGGTTQQVIDYVANMYNSAATIYFLESIPTQVSLIQIWTTADPYLAASSLVGLKSFAANIQNSINGDLAHLLARYPTDNGNGGRAYLDVLCEPYNAADSSGAYAYSNVNGTFLDFPTYSWDIEVVTHEMGHNLGSPHTQECLWGGGGNTQIDDCANVFFVTNGTDDDNDGTIDEADEAEGDACFNPMAPIIPGGGGTIMSYCHLDAVGIDLANGFGPEPGNLIRNRVEGAGCLVACHPVCHFGMYLFDPVVLATAYEAGSFIQANNAVNIAAGLVKYDAGDFITLKPGFSAMAGATGTFHAFIDGCGGALQPDGGQVEERQASTEQVSTTSSFQLYPNPATYEVTLRFLLDQPTTVSIVLLNALGKKVDQIQAGQTLSEGEHFFVVPVSQYPPGTFFVSYQMGDKRNIAKLVLMGR